MTYLDKYTNCKGCPVAKWCGTAVGSIKLCHSYNEYRFIENEDNN
jgi:hypothetical protein